MSLALSSDLIADVIRAADPGRAEQAAQRLKALSGGKMQIDGSALANRIVHPGSFQEELAKFNLGSGIEGSSEVGEAYRSFEQSFLRNMIEPLLPEAEGGLYGAGTASGMWRSLMADQYAGLMSEGGGLGIADTISGRAGEHGVARTNQWPYFSDFKIGNLSASGGAVTQHGA
jgi:hypothetical protein